VTHLDTILPATSAVVDTSEITELLGKYAAGDRAALDRLMPILYDELRRVARRHLRRTHRGVTLDTTGLVNEAYIKLARQGGLRAQDRAHFLAVSACAMRQVLVNRARARAASKRGEGHRPVTLDESRIAVEGQAEWILDLDRALGRLREHDEVLASAFECRFFAGLSDEETAEALGVSLRTAQRQWMRARAWIRAEFQMDGGSS
jgi:RNA polymerase sigma factor (TIGR02999 family)